jgi:glycosyltransferase involved in cell wall biosynthesis
MRVLQVLPSLNSGGVERGTLDLARELVRRGEQSVVMSSGGRMVPQLVAEGSRHLEFPVHAKSPKSLWRVKGLRRQLAELAPDIIHVRSRIPAWMVWLAVGRQPRGQRPALVSTFHGLYSVSRYSAIMGCGDRVIAISRTVRDYICANYPQVDPQKITIIHRGVDTSHFNRDHTPDAHWRQGFFGEYPQLDGKPLLVMPGRLSRWKGQIEFIDLVAALRGRGVPCHGLIVGEPTPGKEPYLQELRALVRERGLDGDLTFLGHRDDMDNIYAISRVVFNLSQDPEPFGRTVIEALAMGVPVVAWDAGGPAESLQACLPAGLVPAGDGAALADTALRMLQSPPEISLPHQFTLAAQVEATLAVYREVLA